METAVRLWGMHGDCAPNHIKYNENDVVQCVVINFILRNNEWWRGNDKINDCVNVTISQKQGLKLKFSYQLLKKLLKFE